jgi:glycyl-tRNA synthetase beta chain
MFSAGERPTGSRDPLGLRRQTQGAVKILADLPELLGPTDILTLRTMMLTSFMDKAAEPWGGLSDETKQALYPFVRERIMYLFEQRGFDVRSVRAVVPVNPDRLNVVKVRRTLEGLAQMSGSEALQGVAALFKRVKNITKDVARTHGTVIPEMQQRLLTEPAEVALLNEFGIRAQQVLAAAGRDDYRQAFAAIAALQPSVAKFFDDVLVMANDEALRNARLALVATLRDLILDIADISEIVTDS